MRRFDPCAAVVGAALLLGACEIIPDDVFPSLFGEEPLPEPPQQIVIGPSPAELAAPPISPAVAEAVRRAPAAPEPIPQPGETGTFVGAKVGQHSRELEQLKSLIGAASAGYRDLRSVSERNAQRYYAIIAAISARLQIGTTPGNPVLVSQWNTGQSELDQLLTDIASLNTLANDISAHAAMSTYLLQSIRAAYGLSGAVEADHRQLAMLEDEVNRTVVSIDRLLNEINDNISRQTGYVNKERRNLTSLSLAIKNGELFGPPLASRAFTSAVAAPTSAGPRADAAGRAAGGARQALVVIRFDRPDVPYKQALYAAVSQALERRPSATFEVVAIAPNRGTPGEVALNANKSKRNAERVFRSLTEMGLPGERVTLSATTGAAVQTNEVHVFVR